MLHWKIAFYFLIQGGIAGGEAPELDTEAQLHPASASKSLIKDAKTPHTGLNKDISSEEKATLRIPRGKHDLNSLEATRHESW